MEYLEDHKILHRNLAARNILLINSDRIKVGDFGLKASMQGRQTFINTTMPIQWTAPDIFQGESFTTKSDVWSFGVVLWEIFSGGLHPYAEITDVSSYVCTGKRLPKLENIPEGVWGLMEWCWESSAEQRPSFQQITNRLKHCQL